MYKIYIIKFISLSMCLLFDALFSCNKVQI